MKIMINALTCLLVVLLFSGCGAQYRASARVQVRDSGATPSQAILDSEVQAIRNIAPAFVSADWGYNVEHNDNTSLIEISVTTPDPVTSASQCNQIAFTYVNMTNAPVNRSIMYKAAIPKQRIR